MAKEKNTVMVRIPKDPLNPDIKIERVIVNGHYYDIEIGKDVEVPKFVRAALVVSGKI